MLDVEENIVNIAMMAQRLLNIGAIKQDEMEGYAGLTVSIIDLAHQFEAEYGQIDYNAPVKPDEAIPDYWEDIDAFAQKHLLERYGTEQERREKQKTAYVILSKREIETVYEKLAEFQQQKEVPGVSANRKEKIADYSVLYPDNKTMEIAVMAESSKKPYLAFTLYDADNNLLAQNTTELPFSDKTIYLKQDDIKYKTQFLPFDRMLKLDSTLKWNAYDPDRITGKLDCNEALMYKILKQEKEKYSPEYYEKIAPGFYPLAFVSYDRKDASIEIAGSFKYMDDGFEEKSHSFHFSLKDAEKQETIEIMEAYAQKTMGCTLYEFQETRRLKHEFEKLLEAIQAPPDTEYPCMPLTAKINTAKNKAEKLQESDLKKEMQNPHYEK